MFSLATSQTARADEPQFLKIKKGSPSPYDGFLLSPQAVSTVETKILDLEEAAKLLKVELDAYKQTTCPELVRHESQTQKIEFTRKIRLLETDLQTQVSILQVDINQSKQVIAALTSENSRLNAWYRHPAFIAGSTVAILAAIAAAILFAVYAP